jgi:hypothetical protein
MHACAARHDLHRHQGGSSAAVVSCKVRVDKFSQVPAFCSTKNHIVAQALFTCCLFYSI